MGTDARSESGDVPPRQGYPKVRVSAGLKARRPRPTMNRGETCVCPSSTASAQVPATLFDQEVSVADGPVLRTDAVPLMGGFAGHHAEDPAPRRRSAEEEAQAVAADEVSVRADPVAALQLLRERVLACTRQGAGPVTAPLPPFVVTVAGEAVADFVSRLLSDQNRLLGRASAGPAARHAARVAAFAQGLGECRELLAEAAATVHGLLDRVEAEFGRRSAAPPMPPD